MAQFNLGNIKGPPGQKGDKGEGVVFDQVIRTQQEFNELVSNSNWLGAVSVAFIGEFTFESALIPNPAAANGIEIPATVKQIKGFNGAKVTVKAGGYQTKGLYYSTNNPNVPNSDYSITDLTIEQTGNGNSYGFSNCTNLVNCVGIGVGGSGDSCGFHKCTKLINCLGTGVIRGTGYSRGFYQCTDLVNCTGTGTTPMSYGAGYGFYECENLMNCRGSGVGPNGWGFYNCREISNCVEGKTQSTSQVFANNCSFVNSYGNGTKFLADNGIYRTLEGVNAGRNTSPVTLTVGFTPDVDLYIDGGSEGYEFAIDAINDAMQILWDIGGGKVVLREGTYDLYDNAIDVPENVILEGCGLATILTYDNNAVYGIRLSTFSTVRDLSIVAWASTDAVAVLVESADYTTIENVNVFGPFICGAFAIDSMEFTMRNCVVDMGNSSEGLHAYALNNSNISNNRFNYCVLYLENSGNLKIHDNNIVENTNGIIMCNCYICSISNNSMQLFATGASGIYGDGVTHCQISDNKIYHEIEGVATEGPISNCVITGNICYNMAIIPYGENNTICNNVVNIDSIPAIELNSTGNTVVSNIIYTNDMAISDNAGNNVVMANIVNGEPWDI